MTFKNNHKPDKTKSANSKNSCDAASIDREGLIVVGVDSAMKVMSFNNEALAMLGPVLKLGSPLLMDDFIKGADCRQIRKAIGEVLARGKVSNHIRAEVVTASKENMPAIFSTYPLYSDHETIQGVVITFICCGKPETDLSRPAADELDGLSIMPHQSLMDFLPEGVFTINTKWQIAFFNRTAEKITGYKRDEVIGRCCWEVFHSDLCDLGCPLKTALETGRGGEQQDIRIFAKEKKYRTIVVNTEVLKDSYGSIVGAIETFRPLAKESESSRQAKRPQFVSKIIGQSRPIKQLLRILPDVAASEANVFLTGESGTGKELFAQTIHHNSSRAGYPFMAVNCSALAETLLESELFGHEKSAFTGAVKSKPGRFELVKQGTLFLDEIGELKPSLQIKLLRVLEQREFERVGGTHPIPLKARIICATNRDLSQALKDGSFRTDFYYRLRTVPMTIPPLRDRKEDIPLLVDFFIHRFNAAFKKKVSGITPEVLTLFQDYYWPGNVRELERTIEHAFVFVKGSVIRLEDLPQIDGFRTGEARRINSNIKIDLSREEIVRALDQAGGRKNKAAAILGISRTSLWRKMKNLYLPG